MIKVVCRNSEEANKSRHKRYEDKFVYDDKQYKALSICKSLYMIWDKTKYIGVFNKNYFEIKDLTQQTT